ncbi:MAG: hypothetical protein AAGD32_11225 [Planctomycetota bacterium]
MLPILNRLAQTPLGKHTALPRDPDPRQMTRCSPFRSTDPMSRIVVDAFHQRVQVMVVERQTNPSLAIGTQ